MPEDALDTITDPPAAPAADAIDPAAHHALVLDNALLRAHVDLDTPQGQLVRDAWNGKTPDLEAIAAHWELVKPAPAPAEPLPPAELRIDGEAGQAGERRDLASTSVVEPNPLDEDPRVAAVQAGIDTLAPPNGGAAGTRDDAQAAVVHKLLEAANQGDARVLVNEQAV
jgi:hypothetical protein